MTPHTHCPRCAEKIWPEPFVGSAAIVCPHCKRILLVTTDGVSFESSRIRATLPVNGTALRLCHVVPPPGRRVY
jgi:hypothetical protein